MDAAMNIWGNKIAGVRKGLSFLVLVGIGCLCG